MNKACLFRFAAVSGLVAGGIIPPATPVRAAEPSATDPKSIGNKPPGVSVSYQLPVTGPLPATYRVTLAIVDPKNPDWILSQFVAGATRTVTAENGGKFSEVWDGLDDNFMPLPPGQYGVKGIFMPAKKWDVDGQYHSVVPRYVTAAEPWRAAPGESKVPVIVGDPVNTAIGDVDVSAGGVGVFCYGYLENARNFYAVDFRKPINYDQASMGYNSGGAAGGNSIATDGITSWCRENAGFVFRTDGKAFGKDSGKYRPGVYQPEGQVTAMAAWRDATAGKSFLYMAERGRLKQDPKKYDADEDLTDKINKVVILDGASAAVLASVAVEGPSAVVARWGDRLWVLHRKGGSTVVGSAALQNGLPTGDLQTVLTVPATVKATDMEVDSHGRIYLTDAAANHVYQYGPDGKQLSRWGRLDSQPSGAYDANSFMHPEKLSCWRDEAGNDHIIVVENWGPDRVTEWSPEGKLQREWLSAQTFANAGYAVDPRHPDQIYIQGHGGYLTRLGVDYASGAWKVQAVWPDVCTGKFLNNHSGFPRMLYRGDQRYLAWPRGDFIYREEGNRWLPSAAIFNEGRGADQKYYLWHDANGDGQVQDEEYRPNLTLRPKGTDRYWGNTWMDDLSYCSIQEGSPDVWQLPVESFDTHGNPVLKTGAWNKLLTDPILAARRDNKTTSLFGGNEVGDRFSSAWAMIAGNAKDGYYINARGPDISANFGAQQKLSRYVPDGKGGYSLKWRVGRMAIHGTADPGEVYGCIQIMPPIGGLITQVDQSRMGMLLYTEEGLYVDTLFPDEKRVGAGKAGPYTLPGEYFTGYSYANTDNAVYLALGKVTPTIFGVEGWTATSNPTRKLETVQKLVSLSAAETAGAPQFALDIRRSKGSGATVTVAHFSPLPGGGPAIDGSMIGWESCEPVTFTGGDKQDVQVLCGFDQANLYLRWHVRAGRKVEPKALATAERIFTHDRGADTVSFYIQGDATAKPAAGNAPRPGDVRFVFGIFQDGAQIKPVALGMYPKWNGAGKAAPLTYKTAAGGAATFEHVGLLNDVKLGQVMDADGQGFVIAAAIPRSRVPLLAPVAGEARTLVNFDATLGGHNRFWWANADGSATRETYDEPTEARLYPGSWSQAQFEAMDGLPVRTWAAIGPFGFAKMAQMDVVKGRGEVTATLANTKFPPEHDIDLKATYRGDETTTASGVHRLAWKPANISGDRVDVEKVVGWKSYNDPGSVYLVSWIHADVATEVNLKELDGHGHHALRGWLNEVPLAVVLPPGQRPTGLQQSLDPNKPVNLMPGWNKLLLRWDIVWGQNEMGLVLDAPPDKLWTLRFSATPPPTGVAVEEAAP